MTGTIAENIYNFLDVNDKLLFEQKLKDQEGVFQAGKIDFEE